MNFCPACGNDGLSERATSPEWDEERVHVTISCRYCGYIVDEFWEDDLDYDESQEPAT